MENNTTYWRGLEELNNSPEFIKNALNEFPERPSTTPSSDDEGGNNRRDFLKYLGFSVAAASLAACETPVRKAIPYLIKPEDVDPSIANFYATTFIDGGEYASVLVKTREGRPIKIEGNRKSGISMGGTSVRAQASVLSLYDGERLKNFTEKGTEVAANVADKRIKEKLAAVSGKSIYIVSSTILSPSLKSAIAEFSAKYPTTKLVTFDPLSSYGIIKGNELSFGTAAIPSYDFSKAKTIVSIGADFLGGWISSIEHSRQYVANRKVSEKNTGMSRHYQFESCLSLTGSNADFRTMIKPSQEGLVVANLYNLVASELGASTLDVTSLTDIDYIKKAAKDLVATKGASLVVSSSNDPNVQVVVNALNSILGSYGSTIDFSRTLKTKQGNDAEFAAFVAAVKSGDAGAVFFLDSNPVYASPFGAELESALSKVSLKVSFSDRVDETSSLCDYITPDHHYLESWGDAEAKDGSYSLIQPTITPLFKTRSAIESFLAWADKPTDAYTYVTKYWKENIFGKQTTSSNFQSFWDKALYDGVFELPATGSNPAFSGSLSSAADAIKATYKAKSDGKELVIYEMSGMGHGSNGTANNPWLLEFPDPITRATWENYLTIPISMAKKLNITMEFGKTQTVKLTVGGKEYPKPVPVLIQPGQAPDTIGLAVGYGRTKVGKAGNEVGANAYPLISVKDGILNYFAASGVELTPTGEEYTIAQVQTHQTIMDRNIIQEATLKEYKENPAAGRSFPVVATVDGKTPATDLSMWDKRPQPNHAWGMTIDLNACTGCGVCVISCQAENNVPVVGKHEVSVSREMHWIRIDRYYSSDMTKKKAEKEGVNLVDMYDQMEDPAENPKVVFQPMMCQHCNNAPCETVCPVLATTHSSEGLNQMTYNRCVGTRYCANNCPYKVRRFNWFSYYDNNKFDYNLNNDLGKMVLNPDVTVRARGVMEKCSMCVQRIQEGKLNAKRNNRRPIDGEIQTACSSSCPADAIVFGDMNDPESQISKIMKQEKGKRNYTVLEEINVLPSVSYLTKIRNTEA